MRPAMISEGMMDSRIEEAAQVARDITADTGGIVTIMARADGVQVSAVAAGRSSFVRRLVSWQDLRTANVNVLADEVRRSFDLASGKL